MNTMETFRILIKLHDAKGLLYKISKIFFENGLNVIANKEFVDKNNNKCFMRTVVSGQTDRVTLEEKLVAVLPEDASVQVMTTDTKNIIIMATKEGHAVGDLLIRHIEGTLDANILAVIANHRQLQPLVERFDIPFFYVAAGDDSRYQHEQEVIQVIEQFEQVDYIVLAKYMRILTPEFVQRFHNQIINIHHSFLPAFIGANPYRQAYERGVKLIGATAHIVTDNLDEGPIITQDTIPVDHAYDWHDLRLSGRDVEKIVLANAVKLMLEDRVFIYNNKTVVL